MHHHIFTTQDTFIYNFGNYTSANFGIDEAIELEAISKVFPEYLISSSQNIINQLIQDRFYVTQFQGTFTGSVVGTDTYVSGSICDPTNA